MLNKRLLAFAGLFLCALVLMGAYNRPYRWWNALLTPFAIDDMNETIAIKPFNLDSLRAPPEGSVSVDQWEPIPTRNEVMAMTGTIPEDLKNPFMGDPTSVEKGKELYQVFCWNCHGEEFSSDPEKWSPVRRGYLDGEEPVARWQMPAAAIDLIRYYTDDHIFAVITHGNALMTRLDYHLDPEERWHIVNYTRSIIDKLPPPN